MRMAEHACRLFHHDSALSLNYRNARVTATHALLCAASSPPSSIQRITGVYLNVMAASAAAVKHLSRVSLLFNMAKTRRVRVNGDRFNVSQAGRFALRLFLAHTFLERALVLYALAAPSNAPAHLSRAPESIGMKGCTLPRHQRVRDTAYRALATGTLLPYTRNSCAPHHLACADTAPARVLHAL